MEYIFGIILILIILIVKNQLKPKYGDLSKLGKLSDEKLISNIQKLPRKVRISHEKITAEISKYLYQELTAIAKVNETSINKDIIKSALIGKRWTGKPIPEFAQPGIEIANAVIAFDIANDLINSFKFQIGEAPSFVKEPDPTYKKVCKSIYADHSNGRNGSIVYHELLDKMFVKNVKDNFNLTIKIPPNTLGIKFVSTTYDKNFDDKYAKENLVTANVLLLADTDILLSALLRQLMTIK